MSLAVIIAEKPSQARNFAAALGGKSGTYQGQQYLITHVRGHVYEFVQPHEMVDPSLADKYKIWSIDTLPWDHTDFAWKRKPSKDVSSVIADLRSCLAKADEIVIGTDLDPSTGEGDLLAWEAIDELGFANAGKSFSRMEFLDESASSVRKAFEQRRKVISMLDEGAYRKAIYRQKVDMCSMQWTRIASILAQNGDQRPVVRQGRLKSAMVKLVGDQLKAHEDYVKKPFFANRFKDENGCVYTDPDEQRHDKAGDVPTTWSSSPVVKDSTSDKSTAPPKLLDLAALASLLVGKGVKAADTLKTYQKMYEAEIVSYPRTEDKTITPEQFNELLPLVDQIAGVVGVKTDLLSHRTPRSTHVKPKGAHGANRPGLKVPSSLTSLESQYGTTGRLIYQTLAKNYLAMLADDYRYEQQKGHVEKYPEYKGIANVPTSMGWKLVFDPDAGDDKAAAGELGEETGDENESSKGLGTNADPFVFEGANKRPEHPSMKWLMKQLEKRDVGTGATRTSTYSEVTNARAKNPLLVEKGRKVSLAQAGKLSWHLLPGTHIGDLALTEQIYADMKAIDAGNADGDQLLGKIADMVVADIEVMKANAAAMRTELGLSEQVEIRPKEKASGLWVTTGEQISFTRTWGGHRFSDDEVARLLAGESISFSATATSGKAFDVHGRLAKQSMQGRAFIGFKKEGFGALDASGEVLPPATWCNHTFTDAERKALQAGEGVEASDFVSKAGKEFAATVYFKEEKKGAGKTIVPSFDAGSNEPPLVWGKVKLTPEQRAELAAGRKVAGKGFTSAKTGKKYDAFLEFKEEKKGQGKRIVLSFN